MEKQNKTKLSKIINGVCIAIAVCCLGLLIYVTASLSLNKNTTFFGYSLHIVVTDSMTPEINVNDLVVAKKTDVKKIHVGDDIVFVSADPRLKGNTVVHRVVAINSDGSFKTSGIKSGATPDDYPATEIIGIVTKVSSTGGAFVERLVGNKTSIFLLLILVACAIALVEVFRIISIAHKSKASEEIMKELKEELKQEIINEHVLAEADKIASDENNSESDLISKNADDGTNNIKANKDTDGDDNQEHTEGADAENR